MVIMTKTDEELKKELEEIIHNEIREIHGELTKDIMKRKSVSLAEAKWWALQFMQAGIMPKTDEFDKNIQRITTMWEICEEMKKNGGINYGT